MVYNNIPAALIDIAVLSSHYSSYLRLGCEAV